jgi:hypothetical protein
VTSHAQEGPRHGAYQAWRSLLKIKSSSSPQARGGLFLDVLFLGKKLLTGAMSAEMGVVPEDGNRDISQDEESLQEQKLAMMI